MSLERKADVSALALEATLTAIKGTGWTIETLKAIYDAINALNNLSQLDILSDATPFAGADIALIKAYVDTVETLLTDATYGLSALDTDLGTLLSRLSSARAGYLDNLSGGSVALAAVATEARLAELDSANMPADLDVVKADTPYLADAALPASPTAGSIGALVKTNLDAPVSTVDTVVDAIKNQTDKVPNLRFEDKLATTPVAENVASASATNLTAGSVTPTYPTGATRQRALLFAFLHASNQAANTHNIGLTVQGQKAAGGYSALLTLTAVVPMSLINVAGATATFAVVIDVTTLVDTSAAQYDFRFVVDSDNAGSVNYTSNFVLALIYSV